MQSKQNHICALWWFQGFKSLTLEFSVGSSPVVQVASGRLWFSDLAVEWQEMLLKNICQGVQWTTGDVAGTQLTYLLYLCPQRPAPLSCWGWHLCLHSEMCYCCHERHMRGSRRVREVQTYLTAEQAKRFLNAAAGWCVYRHSYIFHFRRVTTPQCECSWF